MILLQQARPALDFVQSQRNDLQNRAKELPWLQIVAHYLATREEEAAAIRQLRYGASNRPRDLSPRAL